MGIYEEFGLEPVINAVGWVTRLGGHVMDEAVVAAMAQAARQSVDMTELQAAASKVISEVTGAEAGLVTSGAAAGLLLATAACVTGADASKMARLPDTEGMRNTVIVPRSHRNLYDHAVRTAGVRLVEVGLPDRFSGAGIRDCEPWEIEAAITEDTAAILYVATPWARPGLDQVVEVARRHGVPVIVDAAAQLPPAGNLQAFIAAGADLVAFSGGKAIGGPQSSGILCGRRDLIAAAALQMLDLDVVDELWLPPRHYIDRAGIRGVPPHGIGRPCKVGKEEIIGLLVALRQFVKRDERGTVEAWTALTRRLHAQIEGIAGCAARISTGKLGADVLDLVFPGDDAGRRAADVARALQSGKPAIGADLSKLYEGIVRLNPYSLKPEQVTIIAERLRQILA
ncbi:MAG: aminotransferase class V-fold PLP-dependent enzyme [Pseudomonadota bacterium]